NVAFYSKTYTQVVTAEITNDGRSDFASNPFNTPSPTYNQIINTVCTPTAPFVRNCIRRAAPNGLPSAQMVIPHSWQSSIGVQRRLGSTMSVTADFNFLGERDLPFLRNVNLGYNPATNANFPFSNIAARPYPDWGSVGILTPGARVNTRALDTSFTKRF